MRSQATTKKQAVDSTAEAYWNAYFGEYGRAWVRKIPRRIAGVVFSRTAGAGQAPVVTDARVVPLVHAITKEAVHLEGACIASVDGRRTTRLFSASFDHEGRLLSLDSVLAPAA